MELIYKYQGVILCIIILLLLIFAEKIIYLFKDKTPANIKAQNQYNKGYQSALSVINKDKSNVKDLYNQPFTNDRWDQGWKQACIDNGAFDWEEYETLNS